VIPRPPRAADAPEPIRVRLLLQVRKRGHARVQRVHLSARVCRSAIPPSSGRETAGRRRRRRCIEHVVGADHDACCAPGTQPGRDDFLVELSPLWLFEGGTDAQDANASKTACAWPSARTLYHARSTFPSAPTSTVERMTPI